MTDSQLTELEQTFATTVRSNTIEWALNMRICDLLQANPSLMPSFMRLLTSQLRSTTSSVPVVLALSLLEIVAKNCGLAACTFIDEAVAEALVALVKRREGWKYSLGRNMFKTFGTAAVSGGIDEGSRELWLQASLKVREMLQLWTDAFLLQEGRLRPIFDAYKRLRAEGYVFPEKKSGASAEICLMAGAEESPAYLAAGGGVSSPSSAGAVAATSLAAALDTAAAAEAAEEERARAARMIADSEVRSPIAAPTAVRINITPATVEGIRDLCRELRELREDPTANDQRLAELTLKVGAARDEAMRQIARQMEAQGGSSGSETYLEALMLLLDDVNEVLPAPKEEPGATSAASAASAPARVEADLLDLSPAGGEVGDDAGPLDDAPLPPPPSEALPSREEQERYDEILARYLQERENASFANEEEDAALALRLSLEEDPTGSYGANRAPAQASMVRCAQCNAVNQIDPNRGGSRLFVCYACNLTQGVPDQQPAAPLRSRAMRPGDQARMEVRPTRHAPPPRVMTAGGAAELFIGGSAAPAETPTTGGYVPPNAAGAAPYQAKSFGSFENVMGQETLLGAPPKSKAWSKISVPSWPTSSGSSSSAVKKLGDGAPASEYMSMDDDGEGEALCDDGGGSPATKSKSSVSSALVRGLMPWRRKTDRVQVNEEWELIQPSDQRPYYHNSTTKASQWQPPEVVTSNTGLLSDEH